MVAEQKSKSKFRESSDRNKPSKVSQSIPQTADSATFTLPPEGELDCTQPGPALVRPEAGSTWRALPVCPGLCVMARRAGSPHSSHSPGGSCALAVVPGPF